METPASVEKPGQEKKDATQYASSLSNEGTGAVEEGQRTDWKYWKHYFSSREGWLGDYVSEVK